MNASNAGALYLSIVDPDNTIKSGVEKEDWANGAQYAPLGNAVTVNGVALYKNIQKVYADPSEDAYTPQIDFKVQCNLNEDAMTFYKILLADLKTYMEMQWSKK